MSVFRKISLFLLLSITALPAQAVLLGFNSPPFLYGGRLETSYSEKGIQLTGSFGHGSNLRDGRPSNNSLGSISLLLSSFIRFETESGHLFSLGTIDLAEYSLFFVEPTPISFTGYRADGTSVSTTFVTDGIMDGFFGQPDFETFRFGPEFSRLTHLETTSTPYVLDNFQVFIVPLPGTHALALCSLLALTFLRQRRSSSVSYFR